MTDSDFDWTDVEHIVVREQAAVAVYVNNAGDVVLRQQTWPSEDMYVVFASLHVPALIDAILVAANLPADAPSPICEVSK